MNSSQTVWDKSHSQKGTELNEGTSINIFSGTWQDNASGNVQNQTFNPIDKIVELYERLLKAEQEKVAMLHEIIKDK